MAPAAPSSREGSTAARVMAILDVLADADPERHPNGLGVSEVAALTGRDKSVTSRQLANLLDAGMVMRNATGRYELSWRLLSLAARAGNHRLTRAARPVLTQLALTVQERAYLSVLEGGEVLTVLTESSRRQLEATGWLGRSVPVHTSSAGMALLSDLDADQVRRVAASGSDLSDRALRRLAQQVDDVRTRGYATSVRQFNRELAGIGVPVHDAHGHVIAAINISGPATRIEPRLERLAQQVVTAARHLERALLPTDPDNQHG